MIKLKEMSAVADLLPVTIGDITLSEADAGPITAISAFPGQDKAVSAALKAALGIGLPGPGKSQSKGEARCQWFGHGHAVLIGVAAPDLPGAALVDQSDGWAVLRIEGEGVEDVLARLVPVDLRAAHFARAATARTLLGHMQLAITRVGVRAFELMVFRSMAVTAVEELEQAMKAVRARG